MGYTMTKTIIPHKPFYFIRHGETDWNKEGKVMGQADIPLNQTGLEQALRAANLLQNIEFDRIVSSPLSRALKTAQIIAEKKQKPIDILEELKELSVGILEGQRLQAWEKREFWEKRIVIERAEHLNGFSNRIRQGLMKALSGPDVVLIVSHGGVYRTIRGILGLPYHAIENCVPVFYNPVKELDGVWDVKILL